MGASEGFPSRCTQQLRTRSSSPAPNNNCWVMARFGMPRWCGGFPFDGGCVPPAGWAEAGGANQPPGMSVMSFLAGCVLSPRGDGTVCRWWLVCGGRRWAPRRAPWRLVAGSLGRRGSLSERRRRAPRLFVNCLMASAQIWSVRCSPSPRGGGMAS